MNIALVISSWPGGLANEGAGPARCYSLPCCRGQLTVSAESAPDDDVGNSHNELYPWSPSGPAGVS